jgi:hypothetical protein
MRRCRKGVGKMDGHTPQESLQRIELAMSILASGRSAQNTSTRDFDHVESKATEGRVEIEAVVAECVSKAIAPLKQRLDVLEDRHNTVSAELALFEDDLSDSADRILSMVQGRASKAA